MDMNAHCSVVVEHLTVLRHWVVRFWLCQLNSCSDKKVVGILVVGVHILLRESHEKEDVWWAYDEPDIPNRRIERSPKAGGIASRG